MECEYCGSELTHEDVFGNRLGTLYFVKDGDIFCCQNGKDQDGSCESENFNTPGSFYSLCSESHEVLYEGYPC